MIRFVLSLALIPCFLPSALADIPPPPPQRGFKRVPCEQLLKLEKELPGYKFHTFQQLGLGGKLTIGDALKLGTEKSVPVPSSSSPSVRTGIVAVPEKVMDELKSNENLAKLLSRDNKDPLPAGVVVYETHGTIRDVPARDPRTKVENVITVSADEKAGVKFSAAETPAPPPKESSVRPQLQTLIASIAASLAIVSLGFWYVRRK